MRVLARHLGGGARDGRGHGLVDGGERGRAVGAVLEANDDADDARRVLLGGRVGRRRAQRFAGLRGQRGALVAHGQDGGGGRGRLGGGGARVGLRGGRLRRREGRRGCDRERARAGERDKRRWCLRCHLRNSNVLAQCRWETEANFDLSVTTRYNIWDPSGTGRQWMERNHQRGRGPGSLTMERSRAPTIVRRQLTCARRPTRRTCRCDR